MTSALDSYSSPLWDLGIDEVEPMVCEDTFDNRRRLRSANIMWSQLNDDETGLPSGLIRAFTEEELTARRDSVWDIKKHLMVHPENPYSDYKAPGDLPMDADLPWWMKQRLRGWMQEEMEGKPEEKRRAFPVRCEVIRMDGTRCWNWAPSPHKVKRCKKHMAWEMDADTANAKLAKLKFMQAAPAMADGLEGLALDKSESGAVRLKAMTEILDRAGVRGGTEIDITGEIETRDSHSEVAERLSRLAERMAEAAAARETAALENTVDGEVVEDESPE